VQAAAGISVLYFCMVTADTRPPETGVPKLTLDNCPPVLRVEQAAEVALVDAKTIRRAIHRGELRALVSGRVIRIHRASLDAWLTGG
jgi:excisionase family DNA binding protein